MDTVVVFVSIASLTALFAVRTVRRTIYWRLHQDETIRPWMTIPYVRIRIAYRLRFYMKLWRSTICP